MTKEEFRTYIKEELGFPLIQVEVSDTQLDHCISKAVKKFTDIAVTAQSTDYILFKCSGKGVYTLSRDILDIIQITNGENIFSQTGFNGYIDESLSRLIIDAGGSAVGFLMQISATRELMQKYFHRTIHYTYNAYQRKLYVHENFVGDLLIEARLVYQIQDDDPIFDHDWVQRYAVAEARMQHSINVGKYTQNLVGGATVNYADIRSLAESELEKLNEELLAKWQDLPPVMVC